MKNKIIVMLAFMMLITGCAKTAEPTATVAVITKVEDSDFWNAVELGAQTAGEELGVKIICKATESESEIEKQIKLINEAIDENVDAIILAPLDTEALNDVVSQATEKGIAVLTVDSTITYEGIKTFIGTQNKDAGAIVADKMVNTIGDSGDVLIITHGDDDIVTAKDRKDGFVEKVSKNYKGINIVGQLNGEANADTSQQLVIEFLNNNSEVDGIYATNEQCAVGTCRALRELGLDIPVIGFDSSEEEIKYLEDGTLLGMMVQNPYLMGYLGVTNSMKIIENKSVDNIVDTGVTFVNKDNLNDDDTQILLYPFGK